jgi:hypothetical protein
MISDERIEELLGLGIAKEMPTNLDNRTLARTTAIATVKAAEERLGIKDVKLYMTFNGAVITGPTALPLCYVSVMRTNLFGLGHTLGLLENSAGRVVEQTWVVADPPHTHETRPTEVQARVLVGEPSWVVDAGDLATFTNRIRRALVMRLIGGLKRKDEPDLVIAQVADDGRWASVDPVGDDEDTEDDGRFDLPLAKGMAAVRDVLIRQWGRSADE